MKAQAGIEGMILITIITVVLIFVIITFNQNSNEINKMKVTLEAAKLCTQVKNSINQVQSSGFGARQEITLPINLFSQKYQMRMYASDKKIILSWANSSAVTCVLLTSNVTNSTNSVFDFYQGKNVLSNVDGVVVVSNN